MKDYYQLYKYDEGFLAKKAAYQQRYRDKLRQDPKLAQMLKDQQREHKRAYINRLRQDPVAYGIYLAKHRGYWKKKQDKLKQAA